MAKLKTKSGKQLGGGCLALFGLPFFAAGLFMSWLYFSAIASWWDARSWDEVPCWIESAELEVNRGDDSTTYRAVATYRYAYHDGGHRAERQDRWYRGARVFFESGGDNIGDAQRRAHEQLSPLVGKERPFRCYVNPSDPEEAVLFRDFRWSLQALMAVFVLTFPAVGAGLVLGGLLAVRAKKSAEHAAATAGATSIPDSAGKWGIAVAAYTIWSGLAIGSLLLTALAAGAFEKSGSAWWLLIYPLLWAIPAHFTLCRLRQRLTIGRACFEPVESPARAGQTLRGAIVLERPPPLRTVIEVSFGCEKVVTTGSGDNSTTTRENVWSRSITVPNDLITRDLTGFRVPVEFTLPTDAPSSGDAESSGTQHLWKLRMAMPGSPIRSEFEIPVSGQALADAPSVVVGVPSLAAQAAADLPAMLAARRIHAEFDAAGHPVSLVCPPARNLQLVIFLIIFDLIWSAFAVILLVQEAPLIFRIVWPASAAGIWVAVIWALLHKRTVTLSAAGLELTNQLGPKSWTRFYQKQQITGFSHDSNMSSNNRRFYRVRLEDSLGKKRTLVDNLTESTTAAALVTRLKSWHGGRM